MHFKNVKLFMNDTILSYSYNSTFDFKDSLTESILQHDKNHLFDWYRLRKIYRKKCQNLASSYQ